MDFLRERHLEGARGNRREQAQALAALRQQFASLTHTHSYVLYQM